MAGAAFFVGTSVLCLVGAMVASASGEMVWYYINCIGFVVAITMAALVAVRK